MNFISSNFHSTHSYCRLLFHYIVGNKLHYLVSMYLVYYHSGLTFAHILDAENAFLHSTIFRKAALRRNLLRTFFLSTIKCLFLGRLSQIVHWAMLFDKIILLLDEFGNANLTDLGLATFVLIGIFSFDISFPRQPWEK